MNDLDELYQDTLLEHAKNEALRGIPNGLVAAVDAFNPLCGDEVSFYVGKANGRVGLLGYVCKGCAISQAAASMAAQSIEGMGLSEAAAELGAALEFVKSGHSVSMPKMEDWAALGGVSKFPLRVKCATMPIRAALAALASDDGACKELEP